MTTELHSLPTRTSGAAKLRHFLRDDDLSPDELITVIERMRAADPDAILVAKSNAGMPELVDMRAVYRADPGTMAAAGLRMRDAGASIVGGCCGNTPEHLKAIAAAIAD